MKPSPWVAAVARVVRAVPSGKTVSYSQVALMAGKPGAARAVVRALHAVRGLPWWRVTRQGGGLAPPVREEQARRLRREGVAVAGGKVVSRAPPRPAGWRAPRPG